MNIVESRCLSTAKDNHGSSKHLYEMSWLSSLDHTYLHCFTPLFFIIYPSSMYGTCSFLIHRCLGSLPKINNTLVISILVEDDIRVSSKEVAMFLTLNLYQVHVFNSPDCLYSHPIIWHESNSRD